MIFSKDKPRLSITSDPKQASQEEKDIELDREHIQFSLKDEIEVVNEKKSIMMPRRRNKTPVNTGVAPTVYKTQPIDKPPLPEVTKSAHKNNTKPIVASEIKSALAGGTLIEGKFQFDEPVRIDGSLTGEVSASSMLIVGKTAIVNASIKVGCLIIEGKVCGDVQASDLVCIKDTGSIEANISAQRLIVEDGAQISGNCTIKAKSASKHSLP